MLKRLISLFLILAILLFSAYFIGTKLFRSATKIAPAIPLVSNPLSIDSLAARRYDSTLVEQKTVFQNSYYTSKIITYLSDDLKLYALWNIPSGTPPAAGWPVVIVNHGHIPPQEYSTASSYANTSAYYAAHGFMVFKPDYRGHDQSAGEADTVSARIDYAVDVLNLLSAVKKLPDINLQRIYLYGHSMGGDVGLRVLEICPNCFAAASLWAPAVTDFPESILYFVRANKRSPTWAVADQEHRLAELNALIKPSEYASISSLAQINRLTTSLIIHHSLDDESVPFSWGQTLVDDLKSQQKSVVFYSYPNDNHDIAGHWSTALGRDVEFFNSH